jgi:hypothetical protein
MPFLARKFKTPTDDKAYTVSYVQWYDSGEQIDEAIADVDIGPAVVDRIVISSDGKSFTFHISGGSTTYREFNVVIQTTSTLGQIKNDHIEIVLVNA